MGDLVATGSGGSSSWSLGLSLSVNQLESEACSDSESKVIYRILPEIELSRLRSK